MFRRTLIYALWGAMMSVIVALFLPNVISAFWTGVAFAVVVAGAMRIADAGKAWTKEIKIHGGTAVRLGLWFLLYLIPGAVAITLLETVGVFVLPYSILTAMAMMFLPALVSLNEFVDLSWLQHD
jgi:hypothetical protein